MRALTEQELKIFKYLNNLRESGVTNMLGAPPYVVDMFQVTKQEAHKIVELWMHNFNNDGYTSETKIETI